MGFSTLDKSRWPLVRLTIVDELTDVEFSRMMDCVDELLAEGQRYGMVIDLARASIVPPTQRAELAKRWKRNFDKAKEVCVGAVFVVRSPVMRGVLTAVSWLQTHPHPTKYVGQNVDAEALVHEWLAAAGL